MQGLSSCRKGWGSNEGRRTEEPDAGVMIQFRFSLCKIYREVVTFPPEGIVQIPPSALHSPILSCNLSPVPAVPPQPHTAATLGFQTPFSLGSAQHLLRGPSVPTLTLRPNWVLLKAARAASTLQVTNLIMSLHLLKTSQWLPFALRTK